MASKSKSRTRASPRTSRVRPNAASIRWKISSTPVGFNAVSAMITPLTNQGWSEGGTGALRYQRERRRIVKPSPASASTAASQVALGDP